MSSVFINREDTGVSVAVMHTGWALMKTDALSVEAVARGDSSPAGLVCVARGNPDDNKFVYLINQAPMVFPAFHTHAEIN